MKPRNFPGRKNDRRKAALARTKRPPKNLSHHEYSLTEYSVLEHLILPDSVARSARTKINRSARGKLRA